MDRVMTSINFIETNLHNFNKITWYLSGGIKFDDQLSEASIMQSELSKLIGSRNLNISISYEYILDELSTNTAENFYRTSMYLNTSYEEYDDIYIITSGFHHNRANLMITLIDPSRNYNWILGDLKQDDSTYWENIHIKNVHNDVNKLSAIKF
jgi:hypothetical protein